MTTPSTPTLECDVIMKGGITSGVIYPGLICRLATRYRFRSIGGTSAGAIAAAATAAAEFGRISGRSPDAFSRLAELPTAISAPTTDGRSTLFHLFQPAPSGRALHRVITASMGESRLPGWLRLAAAALVQFWFGALLGAVLGAGTVLAATRAKQPWEQWIGGAGGVVLGLLGTAVGILIQGAYALSRVEAFGLCSGLSKPGARYPALTPWLHHQIQSLAGLGPNDAPLTFRDLDSVGIRLRMMTTDLTVRQPTTLPLPDGGYYFDPQVFRTYFPEDVVTWMENHPCPISTQPARQWDTTLARLQAGKLLPWPSPEDLPVVVAARMSLSFPGLIQAVPLATADFRVEHNQAAAEAASRWRREHPGEPPEAAQGQVPAPTLGTSWFSDGGICSNLPVHLFDAALPSRPTFTIDLAGFTTPESQSEDESENSYLARNNSGSRLIRHTALKPGGVFWPKVFGGAILGTARGWVDARQLTMPGYRDRVVTIFHNDEEGGMNLAMPATTVEHLSNRGAGAGDKLLARFAEPAADGGPSEGWENHRWIRLHTSLAGFERWGTEWADRYAADISDGTPYRDYFAPDQPPHTKSISLKSRTILRERLADLARAVEPWRDGIASAEAPRPRPVLRQVPDRDPD